MEEFYDKSSRNFGKTTLDKSWYSQEVIIDEVDEDGAICRTKVIPPNQW
tara:strand:+ start:239 stop:385 length:147 start_codon:yes stop_codon:yes gene_type:complete